MELIYDSTVHFFISLVGVTIAGLFGVTVGILLTHTRALATWVIAVIEVIQTIPSLATLIVLILIFGMGNGAAIAAIVLYSLLPIIRNTYTGILSVEPALIEAGRGMGMNPLQLLFKVQIPCALSVIISGLRISLITAYGIVTIAVLIGGGGLGKYVYRGVQRQNMSLLMTGAIPICLMAFVTDIWINKAEKFLARHNKSN